MGPEPIQGTGSEAFQSRVRGKNAEIWNHCHDFSHVKLSK
jgi:hypothetical protein